MTVYYIPAGQASHPGTNTGLLAKSGTAGRFGSAFAFTGSNAEIVIADHPPSISVFSSAMEYNHPSYCSPIPASRLIASLMWLA